MRLIDTVSKAEVLETYAELYDIFDDYKEIKKELHKVYDKINALSSALIRCKDCKYFERDIQRSWGTYNGCGVWTDDGNETEVKLDDFCSYAERREE